MEETISSTLAVLLNSCRNCYILLYVVFAFYVVHLGLLSTFSLGLEEGTNEG